MNLSPEQMQFLCDKGLSLADVIEFASLTPSRTKAAERQARYRARQKADADSVTCDVTCDASPCDDAPLSRPPNENNSNPPTHTPEHKPRARKGHRLPVGWEPKPLTADLASAVDRWKPGEIEREMAKFRDWAASAPGQKGVKSDWDATWRNWLRRKIEERQGEGNRNGSRSGFGERQTTREIGERVAARLAAEG